MNEIHNAMKKEPLLFLMILLLLSSPISLAIASEPADSLATDGEPTEFQRLMSDAYAYLSRFEDEKALETYQAALEIDPESYDALWNTVMLHTSIGNRQSNSRQEEAHYEKAYSLAQELIALYPEKAGAHFAYAAAAGRKAQSSGARERVRMSTEIREHAEKAVELDPDYSRAWNVLGNWHHRAANLSRLERFAANALFGGAPEGASNELAREAFIKAIEQDPDMILYYHDKADFYMTIGEKDSARRIIEKALSLENKTSDDQRWKELMQQMLDDL